MVLCYLDIQYSGLCVIRSRHSVQWSLCYLDIQYSGLCVTSSRHSLHIQYSGLCITPFWDVVGLLILCLSLDGVCRCDLAMFHMRRVLICVLIYDGA